MKKRKLIHWKTIIAVIFAAAGLVIMLMMYTKLKELINQLVYLQDTTNIVLSDVSGMQSSIEKTLKEEASMVESYTIEITDLDFAGKDYEVDVSVIPKEYSENTRVSVYFGTLECPLTLDGYAYTGSIRLPLEKSFDGNVTFLLANGKKKSTEVLEDYDGLGMNLEGALSGKLEDAPVIREDTLSLKSNLQFALDGGKQFQFESLELVALFDEEEIWTQDLFADMAETMQDDSQSWKADRQLEREETQQLIAEDFLPVNSYESEMKCQFSYSLVPQENQPDEGTTQATAAQEDLTQQNHHLRLFLRALSPEGYRFEYDVFQGDYNATEQQLDSETFDWTGHGTAYDRKGNAYHME